MTTTGIAAGVIGEGLIVLTALLEKCTKNFFVHLCAKMLAVISILCASFECLMGAILYKYNYTKHEAPKSLNINWHLPYGDHVLRAGFYLECSAGGLFILTLLLTVLDIMYYEKKETVAISPVVDEEKPKNVGKDKTINENQKKGEKLVLEDVTEEKLEKKK
nr:uncharacterized protein LOC117688215 [Crassostrea gigas]